jgi:hypothetical protein
VHVAVVDPGVGTARDIVLLTSRGHLLLAPDNGLLAPVRHADDRAVAWRVTTEGMDRCGIGLVSATFHGRDVFAPLAAELAAGRVVPEQLGVPFAERLPVGFDQPMSSVDPLRGAVVTIDHFGNLITDIDARVLEGLVEPSVHVGAAVLPLRRTYGDGPPGSLFTLINSFGVLEIAEVNGRACDTLGLSRGAPVIVQGAARSD